MIADSKTENSTSSTIYDSVESSNYTAIDLFAGIGGIRMGFENAFGDALSVKLVSEIDKNAQKTYRANFDSPAIIMEDVRDITTDDVGQFDVCLAGFPCQAFSIAGKRLGFADKTRGTLFYEVVRLCKTEGQQPKVIFCENVKALKSHDHGRTLDTIIETLKEIGYREPHVAILNSKDFGVPQNRERIYIVAFRKDIDDREFKFPTGGIPMRTLKSIIEDTIPKESDYLSQRYLNTLKRHRENHQNKGNGFGYVVRDPEDPNECAGALVCGGMGRERNLIRDYSMDPTYTRTPDNPYNDEHIRVMTPREWARLQGFPDSFRIDDVVPKTWAYKQLGNSVTVPVVESIARNIKTVLDRHNLN